MEGIVLSGEIRYNFSYQKTGKDCRMSVRCEPVYSKRVEDMGKINREDMLELTRRMTLKRNCFDRTAGAYLDGEGFMEETKICGYAQNAEENLKGQIRDITAGKHPKQY